MVVVVQLCYSHPETMERFRKQRERCALPTRMAGITGCSAGNGKVVEISVSLYSSSWPLKDVIRTDGHKMCQHAGEEAFHEQAQPDVHS